MSSKTETAAERKQRVAKELGLVVNDKGIARPPTRAEQIAQRREALGAAMDRTHDGRQRAPQPKEQPTAGDQAKAILAEAAKQAAAAKKTEQKGIAAAAKAQADAEKKARAAELRKQLADLEGGGDE